MCYNRPMDKLTIEGVNEKVRTQIGFFAGELLREKGAVIHSIHIVGSCLTADFDEKRSDINSVVVLGAMDFAFVKFLAGIGNKYKKKGVAAPLVMTPEYIKSSLDVFPVEFLDFHLIHKTVHGPDVFKELEIDTEHLRIQCERDMKTMLIRLRQGYISALGDKTRIEGLITSSITGCIPVFRALIHLLKAPPPVARHDVIELFQKLTGAENRAFEKALLLKKGRMKLSKDEMNVLFEEYYEAVEKAGNVIDKLLH